MWKRVSSRMWEGGMQARLALSEPGMARNLLSWVESLFSVQSTCLSVWDVLRLRTWVLKREKAHVFPGSSVSLLLASSSSS